MLTSVHYYLTVFSVV